MFIYLFLRGLEFYKLSYLYYSLYALIITIISGTLVSIIAEKAKLIEHKEVDPKFFVSFKCFSKNKVDPVDSEAVVVDNEEKKEEIELENKESVTKF